jgi:AAA domain
MSLFKPAENTMAYFKAGFMGEAGSGKTHTATLTAIGLVQHLRKLKIKGSEKPVYFLDTEQGSAWVKPMFDDAGIELRVAKTRAFKDLVAAVKEAEANGSVLLIDSISHFWEDLQNSYMRRRSEQLKRPYNRLEFQDWGILKRMWREFSDLYVNSSLHCILCGRLAFEYEQETNEQGRKEINKSGVKMAAEKGLGYEPNMLVWMERRTDLASKHVERTAIVLKDRSQRLDGEQFPNPTFATFLPHIDFLTLGGRHEGVDTSRTSEDMIPDDDVPLADRKHIKREIVVEELDALLAEHGLAGTATDVKQKRAALIKKHFKATSRAEIEKLMPLFDLQRAYNDLHIELTGEPSRYAPELDYKKTMTPAEICKVINDEIPEAAE